MSWPVLTLTQFCCPGPDPVLWFVTSLRSIVTSLRDISVLSSLSCRQAVTHRNRMSVWVSLSMFERIGLSNALHRITDRQTICCKNRLAVMRRWISLCSAELKPILLNVESVLPQTRCPRPMQSRRYAAIEVHLVCVFYTGITRTCVMI